MFRTDAPAGGFTAPVISTPKGNYTPVTDDLTAELKKAAVFAGIKTFLVYIDGNEITEPAQLQTNSVAAVNASIRVEAYTRAG